MKFIMGKTIKKSIPKFNNVKAFLNFMTEKYIKFDKAKLEKTMYDDVSKVQEHILELIHYYNKLKSMKVELGHNYLI